MPASPLDRRGKNMLPAETGGTRLSFQPVATPSPEQRLQHVSTTFVDRADSQGFAVIPYASEELDCHFALSLRLTVVPAGAGGATSSRGEGAKVDLTRVSVVVSRAQTSGESRSPVEVPDLDRLTAREGWGDPRG
jgi:hypothetical protein